MAAVALHQDYITALICPALARRWVIVVKLSSKLYGGQGKSILRPLLHRVIEAKNSLRLEAASLLHDNCSCLLNSILMSEK